MYTNTIEGLFEAAVKGTLAELQKIVESGKVDINQLYENKHIINHLLTGGIHPQNEQKILYLVNAGAIPQHDNQFNILFIISNLRNIELQNKLITLIREAEGFRGVYSKYHFAALAGIAPKTTEEAFNSDHFGLYPIHYAIQKGIAHKGWFEDITYDFYTPINKGLYEGINLFWFIKFASNIIYQEIKPDNAIWSPEKSYQLLISAPLNPEHSFFGESVARYLLLSGDYENFTKFTQGLSAAQRTNLLKSAPLNPVSEDYGEPVALILLLEDDEDSFADFTRLTQNLSPNQCYEILISSPLNPDGNNYRVSVAHKLLYMKRYEDFTRLTQNLSVEQRFELLKSAPYSVTLAWMLIKHKRYTDFKILVEGLSLNKLHELLSEKHQVILASSESEMKTMTLLEYLAYSVKGCSIQSHMIPNSINNINERASSKRKCANLDDKNTQSQETMVTLVEQSSSAECEKSKNAKVARRDSKVFSEAAQVDTLFRSPQMTNPHAATRKLTEEVNRRSPSKSPQ